jgi:hypothetical protein
MLNDVGQLDLIEGGRPIRAEQPVSDDVIFKQPDKLSALKLAQQVSGLDDKAIYMPMQLDKATWSRIMSGQANFPTNGEEQFMQIVGNLIPLKWSAFKFGKGLHDLEDAKDKQIRVLEERVRQQEMEITTLVKYGVIARAK